jgi:TRAP transporter TAXI family solute receptor
MKIGLIGMAAAAVFAAQAASAQTIAIGSTKGTAVGQMASILSKVVSSNADGMQLRPKNMGGTQKYIPVINAGEVEFGIANIVQTSMAFKGTGLSEGKDYSNLRIAATLMAFRNGFLVRNDSKIRKVSDLKGMRAPSGFNAAPLFAAFFEGMLANGGLSMKDMQGVPAIGLSQSWDLLKQGKVDVVITAVGAAPTREMNTRIQSGTRFLNFDKDSPNAQKTLDMLQGVYYADVKPSKNFSSIKGPTTTLGYDFMLFTSKAVSNEVVAKALKAIYDNEKEIKASSPLWTNYGSKGMAKDVKLAYHPGAEEFYKSVGIWKR